MTDDIGVITGRLTVRTDIDGDDIALRVQYKKAGEWYSVRHGRTPLPTLPLASRHDGRSARAAVLDAAHTIVVGLLDRPDG